MEITVLVENTSKNHLPTEHGLSLYIQTRNHKILFDTGQGNLFYENAQKLGIDLSEVDICILSHGHYDHGGGLKKFYEINSFAQIYLHEDAYGRFYHGLDRYIGLDQDWLSNPSFKERLTFVRGTTVLDGELTLHDSLGRDKKISLGEGGLLKKVGDAYMPDSYSHEQYLMIQETSDKSVLFTGCSHNGIVNIMDWFSPDVCIGGFHFMKHPLDNKLMECAVLLDTYPCTYYTCHCTGAEEYDYISHFMKNLNYLSAGDRVRV